MSTHSLDQQLKALAVKIERRRPIAWGRMPVDSIPDTVVPRERHDEIGDLRLERFPRTLRAKPEATESYDEYREGGAVRARNLRLRDSLIKNPFIPDPRAERWFEHSPMGDSIRISPHPLVLSAAEHARIQLGTDQIGRALRALWNDIVWERHPKILAQGIVPLKVLNYGPEVDKRPFRSLGEIRAYWRSLPREALSFTFGVDLMRAPTGEFKICEINLGNIGGRCDVDYVARRFRAWHQHKNDLEWESSAFDLPTNQYRCALDSVSRALPGFEPVALPNPFDKRTARSIQDTHLIDSIRKRRSVGDGETIRELHEMDRHGLPSYTGSIAEVLARLEKGRTLAFEGQWLLDKREGLALFSEGKLRCTSAPGVESLLGNKLLLAYWDSIVHLYLNEAPILAPIPTVVGTVDSLVWAHEKRATRLYNKGVVEWPAEFLIEQGVVRKAPMGYQGQEVIFSFGANSRSPSVMDPEEVMRAYLAVFGKSEHATHFATGITLSGEDLVTLSENKLYAIQPIVRPSQINGHALDVRPLGIVSGQESIHLYQTPWGRISADRISKGTAPMTNISRGGMELPVIVEKE